MIAAAWSKTRNAYSRRAARWFGRRVTTLPAGRAIVSFTFDDFPRSAFVTGATILEKYRCAGTYYASLGLAHTAGECGEYFHVTDLAALLRRGHELGCHTFDHCPAWETSPRRFEQSVLRNAHQLRLLMPEALFQTLSYPITCPRPQTKRRMAAYFACCRGGGQTHNAGTIDVNYLNAFFLEKCGGDAGTACDEIRAACRAGGWLIFATHDVAEQPTRFGCTPAFFEQIVSAAVQSGALVLPVYAAWKEVQFRRAQ